MERRSSTEAEEKVLAQLAIEDHENWARIIVNKEEFRLPFHFKSPISPKAKDEATSQILSMLKNGRSPAEIRGYAQRILRESVIKTEGDKRREEHDKGKTWSSNP